MKKVIIAPVIAAFLLLASSAFLCAQSRLPSVIERLQSGVNYFSEGRWREAVVELRRAQAEAVTADQRVEALYWICMAELSAGEYAEARRDLDELDRTALPVNSESVKRKQEIPYIRGRILYHTGAFNEGIVILRAYCDSLDDNRANTAKLANGLYWIG